MSSRVEHLYLEVPMCEYIPTIYSEKKQNTHVSTLHQNAHKMWENFPKCGQISRCPWLYSKFTIAHQMPRNAIFLPNHSFLTQYGAYLDFTHHGLRVKTSNTSLYCIINLPNINRVLVTIFAYLSFQSLTSQHQNGCSWLSCPSIDQKAATHY